VGCGGHQPYPVHLSGCGVQEGPPKAIVLQKRERARAEKCVTPISPSLSNRHVVKFRTIASLPLTAKHDQAKNIKKIGSKPESVQVGLMNAPRSAAYGRVCCCLWLVGVD
jgi:hypothetical protein